jgi:hypothetical protein
VQRSRPARGSLAALADEYFRATKRDWLEQNLVGRFAGLRGAAGLGIIAGRPLAWLRDPTPGQDKM